MTYGPMYAYVAYIGNVLFPDVREHKWIGCNAVAAPTTIAQIHKNVVIFYLYRYFSTSNRI